MTTAMSKRFVPRDLFDVPNQDPDYKYRWVNSKDTHMLRQIHNGWEVVQQPQDLDPAVAAALGQVTGNPTGGTTVARGDLILMRMRREAFEANIAGPKREARERQNASFDTMVEQTNENTQRALRNAGMRPDQIPKEVVYVTTPESSFAEDQNKKK